MSEPITADRLERLGACTDQVRRFRKLFGDEPAPLSVEAAVEHAQEFDWLWAAKHLLTPAGLAAFAKAVEPAHAAYDEVVVPANAAYWQAVADAQAAYFEAIAPAREAGACEEIVPTARAAYDEAAVAALEAYYEVAMPARAAYREALAAAFAEAYLAHPDGATAPAARPD